MAALLQVKPHHFSVTSNHKSTFSIPLRCESSKCGAECRRDRKYQYESVEIDGVPNTTKCNPYLAK